MRRRILMCLAVLLLLSGMGAASASDVLAAQSEALDLDALQDAAGGYLPDGALEAGISLDEGLQTILNTGSGQISGVVRKAVRSGVLLLTVVLLCGLAEGLYGGMGVSQTTDVVAIVGALAITAVAVADANSLIGMGREALEQMETFSKILLPTITAAAAAAGSPSGAVARQLATMLFSDILITLINRLLLPLVYTYIAACVAYAAVGNEGLKRIAGTLKWVVTSVLTVVLLVFVGYLTVSGSKEVSSTEEPKENQKDAKTTESDASKKDDKAEQKPVKYIRQERYSGNVSRSFYVGENLEEKDIHAKFENGTLTLTFPKELKKKAAEEKHFVSIEG